MKIQGEILKLSERAFRKAVLDLADSLLVDATSAQTKVGTIRTDLLANATQHTNIKTDLLAIATQHTNIKTDLQANASKWSVLISTDLAGWKTAIDTDDAAIDKLVNQIKYMTFKSASLGIEAGGTAAKIGLGTSITFLWDGKWKSAAAAASASFTATSDDIGTGQAAAFLCSLNSAGVLRLKKSALKTTSTAAIASMPTLPTTQTACGYFTIKCSASTAFDATTTTLGAAGLTVAYVNTGIVSQHLQNPTGLSAITATAPAITSTKPAVTSTKPATTTSVMTLTTTT